MSTVAGADVDDMLYVQQVAVLAWLVVRWGSRWMERKGKARKGRNILGRKKVTVPFGRIM